MKTLNVVIARHDILRTAVMWEGLEEAVQVVQRQATLRVEEVKVEGVEAERYLKETYDPRRFRIEVGEAPLLRGFAAKEVEGGWLLLVLAHHLAVDHTTMGVLVQEAEEISAGRESLLSAPVPFREFVARARLGVSASEHEEFFRKLLGDVEEPTVAFGLDGVRGDGSKIEEHRVTLESSLSKRVRESARRLGVSAASVHHAAWGMVLGRVSGRADVVFGTVMSGRLQGGASTGRVLGMFINTLPARLRVDERGAEVCVRETHGLLAQLLRHEHAPLALAQRASGVPAQVPLFSTLLNYRHSEAAAKAVAGEREEQGVEVRWAEERTNYPVTVSVDDVGDAFVVTAQVESPASAKRMCGYMETALGSLVEALESSPGRALKDLEVLPSWEREQLVRKWNATERACGSEERVHGLFESQVERTPEAIALEWGDERWTYAELNARANGLARWLRGAGVVAETRVAICAERSVALVVSLLGVLKAGGAYVPLDPGYPSARLGEMLEDCAPAVVLAQGAGVAAMARFVEGYRVVDVEASGEEFSGFGATNLDVSEVGVTGSSLAYVIYTSGSTGMPKGAMNEHRGVVNRLVWMGEAYGLGAGDVVLQKTPYTFDVSVWELFCTLGRGARLVLARPEGHKDPLYLSEAIESRGVTTVHFVPTMLSAFLEHGEVWRCGGLKRVICSGEALTGALVAQFQARLPGVELHNLYGPTEAAVDVTSWRCEAGSGEGGGVIPLGRPVWNTQMYVLDGEGRPAPIGVMGELYIGGVQVGRGYWRRESLTGERFVEDEYGWGGGRLYRTGDLGRWLESGVLEYGGRTDDQVKLRGHRVELGEIESRLGGLSGAGQVAVQVREEGGEKRLVAYYTGAAEVEWLREEAQKTLPEVMVPSAYVRLAELPQTSSGKVNRRALPAPDGSAYGSRGYEAPVGWEEERLSEIWSELLGVERVGRQDNFFVLGGHSLLAIQLVSRVRTRLGAELELGEVFGHPVLEDQARVVGLKGTEVSSPIARVSRSGPVPVSLAQRRMWFLSQFEGASRAYHVTGCWQLRGDLDIAALQAAFDRIVERHEVLRTRFVQVDGEPLQVIEPATRLPIALYAVGGADDECGVMARLEAHACARFDLERDPLVRLGLARLGAGEHLLRISMHHIVSDGWSIGVFFAELAALYTAFRGGDADPLPPLSIQYADYAVWQRSWLTGETLARHVANWKQALTGAPVCLELPTDRARPQEQSYEGSSVPVTLDVALTNGIRRLARNHGCTLYMALLAAWSAVLGRLAQQDDVVIGTPVVGRGRQEVEPLIGFFVNTLAIRVNLAGDPTVGELLHRTRGQVLAAHAHQDLPFEQVVEALQPPRSLAHTPVFQVLFAWQQEAGAGAEIPGLAVSLLGAAQASAQFDTTLELQETGGEVRGALNYTTALFDRATVERFVDCFLRMLEAMTGDDSLRISSVPWLSPAEREHLLFGCNEVHASDGDVCLPRLFEASAARSPSAVALSFEGETVTYQVLNARANCLARHLRKLGVGPDARVGICADRGVPMIVSVLATLKAGGAYVPLDPTYPPDRLAYMLADSAPAVLLADRAGAEACGAFEGTKLNLDAPELPWESESSENLAPSEVGVTPADIAYVIYTSGSTGAPKGAMVEHRNVGRLLRATESSFGFGAADVWTLFHSFAFDFSVWEIWGALAYGGRLEIVPLATARSPRVFYDLVCARGVTVLNQTPSAFQSFMAAQASGGGAHRLRYVVFGGEALEVRLLAPWFARNDEHATVLVNMYGITETTVHVTYRRLAAADAEAEAAAGGSPIGVRIPDLRVYILDAQRQPVPPGVTGELYVGGAGVCRGYLGRPELTAARFLDDPFVGRGARMYRTGDLGRWGARGEIEYLGRNDFQIKLRGFRIELGEIEARLASVGGVERVIVVAREDAPGDKRLVAYYIGVDAPAPEALRVRAQASLPEYMVPSAYVRLDALPLTTNGKVDRKALPAPEGDAHATRAYEPPEGEIERGLATVWSALLGVERVGRNDHFFELGGHSLLATQLTSRVRAALGVELALTAVFARPVLKDLATAVDRQPRAVLATIPSISREGPVALSLAQQRLWILSRFEGASRAYHLCGGLRLRGDLDRGALQAALDRVVERHEALRTRFVLVDHEPMQVVDRAARLPLRERDLRSPDASAEAIAAKLDAGMREEWGAELVLDRGPLIRASLFRLAEDEYVLQLTMHHIVSDGWSIGLLLSELGALYGAFRRGEPDPLPTLGTQYADYAAWQRASLAGVALERQVAYWRTTLVGAPACLELPADRARPSELDYAGASIAVDLDAELTRAVKGLAHRHGVTPYMTLLAAWSAVLARLAGQDDIVVGTPVAGRSRLEVEPLIGFFVNTLAVRIRLDGEPSVGELLARTKAQLLDAQAHQDLPFDQVVEAVAPPRSLANAPIFQVSFGWQTGGQGVLDLPGLQVAPVEIPASTAPFDLTLQLEDAAGAIRGTLTYATTLFDRSTVERYFDYFRRALRAMAEDDGQPVWTLPILGPVERSRLTEEWNETSADYPRDLGVHDLVAAQARRNPAAIAIVHGTERMTYGELDARASRLAVHLREVGAGQNTRVAICLERSTAMAVALLATWKAGSAYVPLDPRYPQDRLAYMLEDSAPVAVLVDEATRGVLPRAAHGPQVVDLDQDRARWESVELAPPVAGDIAYVIYTSGSTGKPKGVCITHRSLVNFLTSMAKEPGLRSTDTLLAVTTLSFDIAALELYLPWTVGARVILATSEEARDGRLLRSMVERHRVSVLQATPATWSMLVASDFRGGEGFTALCGGEAMPEGLARELTRRAESVWNLYGPTETTVWSTCARVSASAGRIAIGQPIANTRVYVLDRHGQLAPTGVVGEIHIGGDGVAAGYWNRPELTRERFVKDPFRSGEERMYRTGDLGRRRSDGTLEYLGRNDQQVKLRGFRIELGEVEVRLTSAAGVEQAVVVLWHERSNDPRLVAYYTGTATPAALRAHLGAALPEYMVPSLFLPLPSLPLTSNGKVNRKALPAPDASANAPAGFEAPHGGIEDDLASIWADLLGADRVGRQDHFFDLGGHSLLAVRLMGRIRQTWGLDLPLQTLLVHPTLSAFAAVIVRGESEARSVNVVPLRTHGTRRPLFVIHEASGKVDYVRRLADRLDPSIPVYGLQASGFAPGEVPLASVQALAARYVAAIREVQASGPYRLAGWSAGGVIAYAMAAWLTAMGDEVEFLGLIDAKASGAGFVDAVARAEASRSAGRDETEWLLCAVGERLIPELRRDAFVEVLRRGDVEALFEQLHAEGALPSEVSVAVLRREARVRIGLYEALYRYHPTEAAVSATLLRAEATLHVELNEKSPDPTLGWGALVKDYLAIVEIPGDHESLMQEPRIGRLAEVLASLLGRRRTRGE